MKRYTLEDYTLSIKFVSEYLASLNITEYVFIKWYRLWMDYFDSNLDVLLQYNDYKVVKEWLIWLWFIETYSYKEPEKSMMKHGDYAVNIHLHHRVSWNGIDYMDRDEVIRNRQYRDAYWIKMPVESFEDHYALHLAHMFHENYVITPGEFDHLSAFLKENSGSDELTNARATSEVYWWTYVYDYMHAQMKKWPITKKYYIPLHRLCSGFYRKMYRDIIEWRGRDALRWCIVFPAFLLIKRVRKVVDSMITIPALELKRKK